MAINRYVNENYGSLVKIEYAPSWQLQPFVGNTAGTINSSQIKFLSSYGWQSIYCSEDTMGHQQTKNVNENGEYYSQSVVGFVPGDEDAIEAGLLAMANERYVIKVTRPSGQIKIVGLPAEPLDLVQDSNSQTTVPGTPGTAMKFTGNTTARALILSS